MSTAAFQRNAFQNNAFQVGPGVNKMKIGVNLAGLEFGTTFPGTLGHDYFAPTNAEIDYFAGKGFTEIRLPFRAQRMQPVIGGPLDPAFLGIIQGLVTHAVSKGMRVVLDMHNYGSYQNTGGPLYRFGGFTTTGVACNDWTPLFVDLWTKIATVFAGTPGIGYDLCNEPGNVYGATKTDLTIWPAAAQQAINAIRTVAPADAILVEFSRPAPHLVLRENPSFPLTDPGNNILYSSHHYLDYNNSGTTFDWATNISTTHSGMIDDAVSNATEAVGWCKVFGHQAHVGECGAPNTDPHWLTALDDLLAYLSLNNVPFDYWAAGPAWGSYPLSIEPNNGVDAPQMAILTKYI